MPQAHAQLVTAVLLELQDSGNALWTTSEIQTQLDDATRELSEYEAELVTVVYEIESRIGAATSTSGGNLVDATSAHFKAQDVGKWLFNMADRTWAEILSFSSTSQVGISNDIMESGEGYRIFNHQCRTSQQIYLGDVTDYVGDDHGVERVEFPVNQQPQQFRSFDVWNNILTIHYDKMPDSSVANAEVEVYITIKRQHQVTQLTDVAGALNAAGSEFDSSIAIDGLGDSEVIAEGTEFVITGARGLYRTTAALTLATGGGTISFWPPLLEDVDEDDIITFTVSSLSPRLERSVVGLTAGRAVISKGVRMLREVNSAITSVASGATALGLMADKILRQVTDVDSARTAADLMPAIILEANTEIDKMAVEVALANTALDSGVTVTNTVTSGGPNVPGQYATEAAQRINTARGYAEVMKGFLSEVSGNAEQVRAQLEAGAGEAAGAAASANEALAFMEKARVELQVGTAASGFSAWGENTVARILQQLQRGIPPTFRRNYSRV